MVQSEEVMSPRQEEHLNVLMESVIVKKKEQCQRSPDYRVMALLEATFKSMACHEKQCKSKGMINSAGQLKKNSIKNKRKYRNSDTCDVTKAKAAKYDFADSETKDILGLDNFFQEMKSLNRERNDQQLYR